MIAKLKGIVDYSGEDSLIVDVLGVGYLVYCSRRILDSVSIGDSITLWIEAHVRESDIHLYGFMSRREQDCFILLRAVQGVGGKVAQAILSLFFVDDLLQIIVSGDKASLSRVPGIGPKLAGRIISELQERVGGFVLETPSSDSSTLSLSSAGELGNHLEDAIVKDAVSALSNLGYARGESLRVVLSILGKDSEEMSLEILIRESLTVLSQ